jgi:hypothetical protein
MLLNDATMGGDEVSVGGRRKNSIVGLATTQAGYTHAARCQKPRTAAHQNSRGGKDDRGPMVYLRLANDIYI